MTEHAMHDTIVFGLRLQKVKRLIVATVDELHTDCEVCNTLYSC